MLILIILEKMLVLEENRKILKFGKLAETPTYKIVMENMHIK